jgi:hypothetical protein
MDMKRMLFSILKAIVVIAGISLLAPQTSQPEAVASLFAEPLTLPRQAVAPTPKSVWSIGIYTGSSLFELADPAKIVNPVITPKDVTDIDASVVAHPFLIRADSKFYMFFTAKNGKTDRGEIGLAESDDGFSWTYRQIVLTAPYHLAYPFVFESQGQYYMIPEGVDDRSVRLYRATEFPTKWTLEKVLLQGEALISASVISFQDRWWMFVGLQGNETLRLYYATDLPGPWTEHPRSPIVEKDKNIARPGGRPVVIDGTLYRMGQDCYPTYGLQVSAFKVTNLSTTEYEETMIDSPIVKATSIGWSAEGMHHVDAFPVRENSWIAAVDGVQTAH